MVDTSDYRRIRAEAKTLYEQTGKVYCPALSTQVIFGAGGFNHLIYKDRGHERDKFIQLTRFKLLINALKLVELTTTYQEYEEIAQKAPVAWLKKQRTETRTIKFW